MLRTPLTSSARLATPTQADPRGLDLLDLVVGR